MKRTGYVCYYVSNFSPKLAKMKLAKMLGKLSTLPAQRTNITDPAILFPLEKRQFAISRQ
jgi:hypothetical protein